MAAAPPDLRASVEKEVIARLAGDIAVAFLHEPSADVETDAVAAEALARLGPRLAELIVEYEESDVPRDGDEADAAQLANAFAGPDMAGAFYLELLRCEARELVLRYQDVIRRVANALVRHAVLSGDAVAALVHPPKFKASSPGPHPAVEQLASRTDALPIMRNPYPVDVFGSCVGTGTEVAQASVMRNSTSRSEMT